MWLIHVLLHHNVRPMNFYMLITRVFSITQGIFKYEELQKILKFLIISDNN